VKHLQSYGNAFHVHSRLPPTCLTARGGRYNDGKKVYWEWFGDDNLSEEENERSKVVFILREPRAAYLSIVRRFLKKRRSNQMSKGHFMHISVDWALRNNVTEFDDPFGLHHFAKSWTNPSPDYDVLFVTYEALHQWPEVLRLHSLLGLPPPKDRIFHAPARKYDLAKAPNHTALRDLYQNLHPIRTISTKHIARSTCKHTK